MAQSKSWRNSALPGQGAVFEFVVEAGVAGFEADFFAGDPHAFHIGAEVEDIAVGGDEGCSLGILAGSGPTTLLMGEFPRSMIPTFFVPSFILLHLLALLRRKEVGQ